MGSQVTGFVDGDRDAHRLAADLAVFDVVLGASAALVKEELALFAAVRAADEVVHRRESYAE